MTTDRLEGRVLFWAAHEGQITLDVLAAPAGSPDAIGTPIALHGSLPWSPLGVAILTTLERWSERGEPIRLDTHPGHDGAARLRMASDRTWLVVDLLGAQGPQDMLAGSPETQTQLGEGVTLR